MSATIITAKYAAFGVELKRLRLARGLPTHTDLARLLAVKQQTVSRWEAGDSRPRADQMVTLAAALQADPQSLLVAAGHARAHAIVSFDQPLPLPSLSPQSFERFCRALLECLYPEGTAHAAGKSGHKQYGTDITVARDDGTVWSFQCKRVDQFGPTKVRDAVAAHTIDGAKKFILLSGVASPRARAEVANFADWDIWDQDDLSQKLRSLPKQSRITLVDTFFPGQRMALLGEPSPGPWLAPGDFFAPFEAADRPFNHHWTLIGRTRESTDLAAALADPAKPVVSLIGPAGGGKSRVLRSVVDSFVTAHRASAAYMLSPTEQVTAKSLEDLGGGAKLLVVDDAHDRTDLELLIRHVANQETNTRLLLAHRPYAEEIVRRELGKYGLTSVSVTLDKPTKGDAKALATHVLRELGGPEQAADLIADAGYDSPLSVVVGAWIVAKDGLHPELFASSSAFQATVLDRYKEAIKNAVSSSAKDQDLLDRMLRVIALIQPLAPEDPKVLSLYESIEAVPVIDATRLTKLLMSSGILFRRGARYRLSPDLLADAIIEAGYITTTGVSNGGVERVFDAALPEHKANLILNLGRLDWRRNSGDTSDSQLLNALWSGIKWDGDYVHPQVDAAKNVAYFQPRHALGLARRLIDEGHGHKEPVARMIRNAAYDLKYLREACEMLWEIGRDDRRQTNAHTDHAVRLLTEMATPDPRMPIEHVDGLVDYMLSLLDDQSSWKGAFTPFDVLDGALKAEGQSHSATRKAITITSFGIPLDFVKDVRAKVVNAILESLTSSNKRRAFAAAAALNEAIRGPIGLMNRAPSEGEREAWDAASSETLKKVIDLLDQTYLPSPVLVRIAESVGWYASFGKHVMATYAQRILQHLERDRSTRVTRVLMDGWGSKTWVGGADRIDCNKDIQDELAAELVREYPNTVALTRFLNQLLIEIKGYSASAAGDGQRFTHRLIYESVGIARAILDHHKPRDDDPVSESYPIALAALMREAPEEASSRVKDLLQRNDKNLSLVARAYSAGTLAISPDVEANLRRIFSSEDPGTLRVTPWLFHKVAEENWKLAIQLLVTANPRVIDQSAHELFLWLGHEKQFSVESLSEEELKGLLGLLSHAEDLDDHSINAFLVRVAATQPRIVVQFFVDRVVEAAKGDDWWRRGIGGFRHGILPPLDILKHEDGQSILREILDWALLQIGDRNVSAQVPGLFAKVFGVRHPLFVPTLETWCEGGTNEHYQLMARVLREVAPSFVFDEYQFVTRILRKARSIGTKVHRDIESSLFGSAISGMRKGSPGEPFPQDVERKERSAKVLSTLSTSDPAFRLYSDLLKDAERDIERSLAEGRAMAEEDGE